MATIEIIQGDHGEARRLLKIALFDSEPTKPDYQSYVEHYCRYYMSVLDGDEGMKVKHLESALRLSAPPIIKQWLPLS